MGGVQSNPNKMNKRYQFKIDIDKIKNENIENDKKLEKILPN